METKKNSPSYLTEEDFSVSEGNEIIVDLTDLGDIEIINESDESFSQACVRHGVVLYEDEEDVISEHYLEDYMTSVQIVLQDFCKDNPKITKEEFTTWYQQLIDNEELFRFDKHIDTLWKDVSTAVDTKMNEWMADGLLDAENANLYTYSIFCSIIIMAIKSVYEKLGCYKLDDNMFFKDPLFGKYKIIALDYADNTSLNDFDNPHAYNRFDVEGLIIYAMGEFDEYEDYREICETYQEVQEIVYEAPNRLLGETKKILEQQAKKDKKRKKQYAVLYAGAVIEWYLNHH